MSTRYRGLWLAVVVFAALVLVGGACTKKPDAQISVAGVTNLDSLTLRDNLVVGKASTLGSGGLAVTGNFSLSNGSIINSKGAVTVTDGLDVSSQIVGRNGLNVAGGITSTGSVSATAWGLFYGVVLQPAMSQVVTANYGITPTNYSVMYLADDGAQATGTIALDTTVSIVNGTYPGQLLLVFWMDADGATLTIQDGGNMQGPSNADVVLGYQDSALFMWDALSTDWLCINVTDL